MLEVFFDYACPYCRRAHGMLKELIPLYPGIEVVWRPCEAHPRPDRYGPHSELCIQGMFFALARGADLWEYHGRMYDAIFMKRADVENAAVLARAVRGLLDEDGFFRSLEAGEYAAVQREANRYADQNGVWVVPAYRMDGRRLDSVEDVGINRGQLAAFLDAARMRE